MIRTTRVVLAVLLVVMVASFAADAWTRSPATTFATLPTGEHNPEGITADAAGNIYVTTFDVSSGRAGQLFVFGPGGQLLRQVSVATSSNLLLGLAFHPTAGLLVIDFGGARVLSVDPVSGAASVFMTVAGGAGLNALTVDGDGNVYASDSFQGIIWKTGPAGGAGAAWVSSPLLTTSGVPGFGANGLAFNKNRTALFVANTGNDTIVRVPVSGSPLVAGAPEVFVNSINGADGLILDEDDNVWVAANQADEIVVVEPITRRVIARLGDFEGLTPNRAPKGLLFPASLVRVGGFIYVTNLALDLRLFDNPATPTVTNGTIDSPWASEVLIHTISRINAHIPPVPGFPLTR